ncbi:helix-turn-helix domain-containing protein [Streptomyces sp. SDT5-1]|uniref:helix-turn-helix domain-containing protein n=1 Tax=Streptomyces sp. SDT5-1 TaxID=3406418 RepID=UPI003FD43640
MSNQLRESLTMAPRHFDRDRVRTLRRARDITQSELGDAVGVGDSTVASWEAGSSTPDGEKLPLLAKFFGLPLDEVFPRPAGELPDLADLRCDAGFSQYQTRELIGTKSSGPVANAERGKRRLSEKFQEPLAKAYGVTLAELLAAQERSFGNQVPTAASATVVPRTAGEKITYLLEHSYPGTQTPPSDAEIAQAVNEHAGAEVISEEEVRELRTGGSSQLSPIIADGLADLFGVSPLYFQSDDTVARQVVEGLRMLAAVRTGAVGRVATRGLGPEGMSDDLLAFLNHVVEEMADREVPGASDGPGH